MRVPCWPIRELRVKIKMQRLQLRLRLISGQLMNEVEKAHCKMKV